MNILVTGANGHLATQHPNYTVLRTNKIYKDYNIRLRHWKEAVDDFIENHKSNLEHFGV